MSIGDTEKTILKFVGGLTELTTQLPNSSTSYSVVMAVIKSELWPLSILGLPEPKRKCAASVHSSEAASPASRYLSIFLWGFSTSFKKTLRKTLKTLWGLSTSFNKEYGINKWLILIV